MKPEKPARTLRFPSEYATWLTSLKDRVRSAQLRAAARVNHELIGLYWNIGRRIVAQQREAGWGASIIPTLAVDLHVSFPEMAGFSERNIGRMVAFHREYPDLFPVLPQPAAKLTQTEKVPQAVAQITDVESAPAIVPQLAAQLDTASLPTSIMQQVAAQLPGSTTSF